jgi:hypothetical protein
LTGTGELLAKAIERSDFAVAEAVDRAKSSRKELPLVAVGGGSILIPDSLVAVSEVVRPENFDVANPIGAAMASVSGEIDRVY